MTDLGTPPVISVAIPCRNEEANIREIAAAVIGEMEKVGIPFEILFIDNGSTDATAQLGRELCAADPRIKLIINTRNFGQMRSPTHAIFEARGKAVIGMCADFQDPPNLIPRFIERWQAGVPIVLGIRETEKSRFPRGFFRNLFYSFAKKVGDYPIIPDATGFGLYDRKVVDAISALNEPEPFFRGLLVETGYAIEKIMYARPQRRGGLSNNNFFVLLDFAISGLSGSSKKLARLPLLIGFLSVAMSAFTMIGAIFGFLLGYNVIPWIFGFAIELQFGLLFIFLGLIGDQVRVIAERTRGAPLVIEQERVNFPKEYRSDDV